MEGDNVKIRKEKFYDKVLSFRIEFNKELPFRVENTNKDVINAAYAKIGEYYFKLQEIRNEANELRN